MEEAWAERAEYEELHGRKERTHKMLDCSECGVEGLLLLTKADKSFPQGYGLDDLTLYCTSCKAQFTFTANSPWARMRFTRNMGDAQ